MFALQISLFLFSSNLLRKIIYLLNKYAIILIRNYNLILGISKNTKNLIIDGTPYAVKVARRVWSYTKSERIVKE